MANYLKKLAILALSGLLVWGVVRAAEINDFSTTDANNTNSSYGFPENMAPSALNDNLRAVQGILARWNRDISGSVTSYGTGTAFRITPNRTFTGTLYDGATFLFEATTNNTGSTTLQVGTLTPITIKKQNDRNLASGDIESGQKVLVVYDGSNFQLLSSVATDPSTSGFLLVANNLSDVASAAAARTNIDAQEDVITTQGDLVVGSAAGQATRFGIGASNFYLRSTGTTITWAEVTSGLSGLSIQAFTSTGTYTKPSTLGFVIVTAVGGGGGGTGSSGSASPVAGGGGGGACIIRLRAADIDATVSVTVGTGGAGGGAGNNAGNAGNTSSFGSHCSATGGAGGVAAGDGGQGGIGSGGNINIRGGGGDSLSSSSNTMASGGNSYLGGKSRGSVNTQPGFAGEQYGGGGSSGRADVSAAGGNGANGIVIIEEYQ